MVVLNQPFVGGVAVHETDGPTQFPCTFPEIETVVETRDQFVFLIVILPE